MIVISVICISFNIFRTISVGRKLETLLDHPDEFPDFEFLSYWQTQFNSAIAITVFMAWVKVSVFSGLLIFRIREDGARVISFFYTFS